MDIITQFPHSIIDEPDMGITLSDGCRLSARVFMPEEAKERPFPAILEYIPYRKRDGTIELSVFVRLQKKLLLLLKSVSGWSFLLAQGWLFISQFLAVASAGF